MVAELVVAEASEFNAAVAGLEIEWVRTDEGFGPARMVASGDDRASVSSGGMDFSAVLQTQVPDDRISIQLVTSAPAGMRWCGSEAGPMEMRVYRPGADVFGKVPAGSRAITLVASWPAVNEIGRDLGLAEVSSAGVASTALPATPGVRALQADLLEIEGNAALLEQPSGSIRILESTARALASMSSSCGPTPRGFDSSEIVKLCLDHVEMNSVHQPTVSELCRVAHASESRLRQAFVEMVALPPTQYFQVRVLSRLRDDLLASSPDQSSVTSAAMSLGLTQLGRVAGRYRSLFGETPRETLRRTVTL